MKKNKSVSIKKWNSFLEQINKSKGSRPVTGGFMSSAENKYVWTQHSRIKMQHYKLTESRIKRIIRHPTRMEEGVLDNGVASMQPAGGKQYSEIWVMYLVDRTTVGNSSSRHAHLFPAADSLRESDDFLHSQKPSNRRFLLSQKSIASVGFGGGGKIKIITAWRYPGKSPKRDPIPESVLQEIRNIVL